MEAQGEGPPKQSLLLKAPEGIVLEHLEKLLGDLPRHHLLMRVDLGGLGGPLLQVPPLSLIGASLPYCLDSLCLHQLCFSVLSEPLLVRFQLLLLKLLDDLHPCVLKSLAHQNLQDWLGLQLEVKQIVILVMYLHLPIIPLRVWNVGRSWRPVNEVIRLQLSFIGHVFIIL